MSFTNIQFLTFTVRADICLPTEKHLTRYVPQFCDRYTVNDSGGARVELPGQRV